MKKNWFKSIHSLYLKDLFGNYKLHASILILIASLIIAYCVLSLVISDGIGIPQMMQRTITLNQEEVYNHLEGFEVRGDIIFTSDERGFVNIDIENLNGTIGRFNHVTVFISRLSDPNRNVRLRAREESARFSDGYSTQFRLNEGQNTIRIPNNEWAGLELRLGHRHYMSMIVDGITLSRFVVLPNYFLFLFLLVATTISVLWYFIVFRGFGTWLIAHQWVIFAFVIIFQTLSMVYYVDQKGGYHTDEITSLGQANGRLTGGMSLHMEPNFRNSWHYPEYFWNLITVQQGERFDFSYVYNTLTLNNHPLFYHMQLHFVGSLFPNTWNNWMGAGINIFWLTATAIVLYKAAKLVFDKSWMALLPVIIWGFSNAAMSNAVLFRMYSTLIFFFTALSYLALMLISKKVNIGWKFYVSLAFVIFFGTLTHYYFLIFFSFSSLALLLWLLFSKEYIKLRNCIITTVIAASAYLLFWPHIIHHLSQSGRGTEAVRNFLDPEDNFYRIGEFAASLNRQLFGDFWSSCLLIIFVLAIVSVVLCMLFYKKINFITVRHDYTPIVYLLFVTVPYFLIVSAIAPLMSVRYIIAISPSIILCFLFIIHHTSGYIHKHIKIGALALTTIILVFFSFYNRNVQNMFPETPNVANIVADYEPHSLIVASFGVTGSTLRTIHTDFFEFQRIFIASNLDAFTEALNDVKPSEAVFIYMRSTLDEEEVFGLASEILLYEDRVRVYSHRGFYAYRIIR
ncbi:MAG: hypothetical protein FWC91_01765 [Defluviitaleaceae bacterium]|nr:hypothetical protein [Defluviitaleaceae bacterium]